MLGALRHAHAGTPDEAAGSMGLPGDALFAGDNAPLLLALTPERISESLRVRETIHAGAEATARARAVLNRVADTVESPERFRIDLALTDLICQRALDVATPERDFDVEISRAPGRVRVELVDDGLPASHPQPEPAPFRTELELVAELADRWGMSRDATTTIWFELETGPCA